MSDEMVTERDKGFARLRDPFPKASVGILPKPYKKESPKGNCNVCDGYHGLPAAHLDYVGHANITDRLLSVDPEWTWEPLAFDDRGLPTYDNAGNLWIKLTVLGVTRLGVGDGPDPKQRIGDALRNAAMRFGVGLDLWSKDELESEVGADEKPKPAQSAPPAQSAAAPPTAVAAAPSGDVATMSLKDLTLALDAAGLELTGNSEAKRARLAAHRAGSASPDPAPAAEQSPTAFEGTVDALEETPPAPFLDTILIEHVSAMTTTELANELRAVGLRPFGAKNDMQAQLLAHLVAEPITAEPTSEPVEAYLDAAGNPVMSDAAPF